MGTLFRARCECGYTADTLLEGIGMAATPRVIARCDHCHQIVDVAAGGERRRCPRCRRAVVVLDIWERDADGDPETEVSQNLECPRCQRSTLQLERAGLWD